MKIGAKWKQLGDVFLLSVVQVSNLIIPLILTPHLSKIFTRGEFGQYVAVLSLSLTLSIFVEYGFSFSGVRSIVNSNSPKLIFSEILFAKLILSTAVLMLAPIIALLLPEISTNSPLFYVGVVYAILLGLNPVWYFQATFNIKVISLVDIIFKFFTLLFVFLIVRHSGQSTLVLAIQSLSTLGFLLVSYFLVVRQISLQIPSAAGVTRQLKHGWEIFLYKMIASTYTTGNLAVFRILFPADFVAIFSNGERISGAAKSFTVSD